LIHRLRLILQQDASTAAACLGERALS
jgi:hypothetical protein